MEWKSVKEVLPKQGGVYLGAILDEEVDILFYYRPGDWRYYHGFQSVSPTHWMPLPQPPKN